MADTPTSQEPNIVLVSPQQQGIVGPFLLADLENALAAYVQNQGQVTEPQNVNIVLSGPIVLNAHLPPIQFVKAQLAGAESFLLADLENALAAYVQNHGQSSEPQLVDIYSRLDDPSGGGGGVPK